VKKSNGKVPMADAYNPHFSRFGGAKTPDVDNESHPKRMRRDPKSKVSFETEVKVCVVNNVDVLRKRASAYPVTTGTLPRSILCTAAIEDFQDNDPKRPSANFTTKHKSETMDLKSESTEPRRQKQFKRRSSTYKPGSWACSSDCEIIDTSGARRSFEEFKELQYKAGYQRRLLGRRGRAALEDEQREGIDSHKGYAQRVARSSWLSQWRSNSTHLDTTVECFCKSGFTLGFL
jgi:hypothetical protein